MAIDLGAAEAAAAAGVTLTQHTPSASGNTTFDNDRSTRIIVYNNSGGVLTFTATTQYTAETTLNLDDRDFSLANSTMTYVSFDPTFYDNTSSPAQVELHTFSTVSGVTILVIK